MRLGRAAVLLLVFLLSVTGTASAAQSTPRSSDATGFTISRSDVGRVLDALAARARRPAFTMSPRNPQVGQRVSYVARRCSAPPCRYQWRERPPGRGAGTPMHRRRVMRTRRLRMAFKTAGRKYVAVRKRSRRRPWGPWTYIDGRTSRRSARGIMVGAATPLAETTVPAPPNSGSLTSDPPAGPVATPTPTPVVCDSKVSTRAALVSALGSTANSGKTVCVTSDITGSSITVSTDMTSQARFVAQPRNMTLDMVPIAFQGASRVTIEGFEMTGGGFTVNSGAAATSVHMKKNFIHGFNGDGLDLYSQAAMTDIQFVGNRLECLTGDGNGGDGYGIRTFGGPYTAPKFNYNTILGCGNSGDGMEIGSLRNFEVIGNVITGIGGPAAQHADALMIWSDSSTGVVKHNRITKGPGTLISPDGQDILLQNNLIANHNFQTGSNQCIDATANGTSGNVSPLRFTFRQNTVWDCDNGGLNMNQATGSRGQNILDRNLIVGIQCGSSTVFSSQDMHNMLGGSKSCSPGGTNISGFSPAFADTVDYRPTNLPSGYTDVGYRAAPAGHTAVP